MPSFYNELFINDQEIAAALIGEERRQQDGVELIPSENYTYPEVLELLGSVFTNKYSEGYPGRRYYGGQQYTDSIENLARQRACSLFRAEHANVQPLSGSPMNQAVYLGLLQPGDTILAMDLSHGGHLTHGAPVSHMGRLFNFVRYKTAPSNGAIDFDELRAIAREARPKMVLCGYSSYPRDLDYAAFKNIADEVGALTMADVSHYGGLVAANVMRNPLDAGFDIMTTTSHKTLRGPRGGIILCRKENAGRIDASVFPGLQGGPHMNVVAGIAVTLKKAATSDFQVYARQVLRNAKVLAGALMERGMKLVTDGTDNHMMVVDTVASVGLDGRAAEDVLDAIAITTNKQVIPDDPRPPLRPSGIRIGTPAATTRGMGDSEMRRIGEFIAGALQANGDDAILARLRSECIEMCRAFPVPGVVSRSRPN
ncbi:MULTISPECIES: serine hydroxymethyltransferase [unclassified Bradyrhizobium]|uniref:serine hydroxymethyltransferase n=1 Tax=unclassified Bradyrhizobium TaxID=2631580 RepID=UPI001BA59026|nr:MULTISPECIES: serine hydroxymethyltransferase [unclassified Bradyrhizobium]MBR1208297.1 serine hydroxymethyltransferase [Bradyrhizobium sp. AUGA SZCCT0124]MBR1316570.1 serine hydroxymethyltransferase [Bradyrhizobium sp. AUGA SZCCT0051]MBR1344738.1 serine hydroxymethyltransferase [Bradyrhizobium sp. AUGA SZCCT0105]MBR1359591.1 serine hydroxymethyltransferase [Bradyrhizobium sp. AUGA SZCCT0045]